MIGGGWGNVAHKPKNMQAWKLALQFAGSTATDNNIQILGTVQSGGWYRLSSGIHTQRAGKRGGGGAGEERASGVGSEVRR